MLSKKELLKSMIGKKISVLHETNFITISNPPSPEEEMYNSSYCIITEVGEDIFTVHHHYHHYHQMSIPMHKERKEIIKESIEDRIEYYSINHVVFIDYEAAS